MIPWIAYTWIKYNNYILYTIYMNPMRIESQLELTMNSKLQKSEKNNPPIPYSMKLCKGDDFWLEKYKKNKTASANLEGVFKKNMPIPPSSAKTNKQTNKQKKQSDQVKHNDLDLPHTKECHLHHQDCENIFRIGNSNVNLGTCH